MTELGPLPMTHPREVIVHAVERTLDETYSQIVKDSGLTTGESLRVLSNFLSSRVGRIATYAIRHERHGDTDKPGGVA